jgi:hypothetical protein
MAPGNVRDIRLLFFEDVFEALLIKVHKAVSINTWARRVEVASGTALPVAQRILWALIFVRDATRDHLRGSGAMLSRRMDNENAVVVNEA